jgi:hypothetical protein
MRNILIRSLLLFLLPMAACGEEEGGNEGPNAADVFQQRIRFYQLVCTCNLPPAQQNMVVSEGSACVSDYVGGAERRSCSVDTVDASWATLGAEAECWQEAYAAGEDCIARPPGCDGFGACLTNTNTAVSRCGTAVTDAISDC